MVESYPPGVKSPGPHHGRLDLCAIAVDLDRPSNSVNTRSALLPRTSDDGCQ